MNTGVFMYVRFTGILTSLYTKYMGPSFHCTKHKDFSPNWINLTLESSAFFNLGVTVGEALVILKRSVAVTRLLLVGLGLGVRTTVHSGPSPTAVSHPNGSCHNEG